MAARTSWNPRAERVPDYLDDDALDPAYDDLLDSGFDEYGRLTRRRSPRRYYDDSEQEDLRRAVDNLARQVDAATRQAGRARVAAPARGGQPLDALDRLEARLDALGEEARRRSEQPGQSSADRARVEAQLERHFAALDQRIAARHDLARGKNVDGIRDDLNLLSERVEGLATNGQSVAGSLDKIRDVLGDLGRRLESDGWGGAGTLNALQDRLDLITEKLAQLELTPSALSAVERGYSHILERVSRIEQLAGQSVAADDLWEQMDSLREQISAMQSGEGLSGLEARIAGLSETIETLSSRRGHDPSVDRVEMKLADIGRTIAIIRDRRDMHSGAIEARLADITARLEKIGHDRGRIDFTPVERQIAALAGRIDQVGSREPEIDVSGMERQIADLGQRIEQMLKHPPQQAGPPALDAIEHRLSEMQSRLEEIYVAGRSRPATDSSDMLSGIDRRLSELHGRLDDITIASGADPADLAPIATRLEALDGRLDDISRNTVSSLSVDLAALSDKIGRIDEQLRMMAPSDPELPLLLDRLGAIESRLESASSAPAQVDLTPLAIQLSALDQHLSRQSPSAEVDLTPVSVRLQGVENRIDELMDSFPAETRSLADRLEAIDRRFDELSFGASADLSPLNEQLVEIDRQLRGLTAAGSGGTIDLSPITNRLDAMDDRLADRQPGQSTDFGSLRSALVAIEERLDGLAGGSAFAAGGAETPALDTGPLTERLQAIEERLAGIAGSSADGGMDISPLTERLQAIEQRLEGLQQVGGIQGEDDDRLVTLLGTFEAALRKISTSDDVAALAEKVGGLHEALDRAGEGSALDEMADLRNDITYLRRELRSMPMMAEAEDGSGGIGSMLDDIRDRLDRIPAGGGAGAGEDAGTMAGVIASIENSIGELRRESIAADDDTRRMLDAMNHTMQIIAGRMLEDGAAPMPAAERAFETTEEPDGQGSFDDTAATDEMTAEPSGEDYVPELSIGVEQVDAEPEEDRTDYADTEGEAGHFASAEDEVEPGGFNRPSDATESLSFETAADMAGEVSDEPAYDTAAQTEMPELSDAERVYDTATETGMMSDDVAAREVEPEGGDRARPVFESAYPDADDDDAEPQMQDDTPPAGADTAPPKAGPTKAESGSQSILGRLTSSQILKRATGGRAESFTPEEEEQAEQQPDTLYEPGTDTPIDSSLRDAPSSDTAVMSGEAPAARTRQGAGLGDLAAASGLDLGNGDQAEQGNQFLSAARKAARAAVLEASQVDPTALSGSPAQRSGRSRRSSTIFLALGVAVVLAFIGYKYWRGELNFGGFSIGGFSLGSAEPADAGIGMAAMPASGDADIMTSASGNMLMSGEPSQGDAELEPISPDGAVTFGAPESIFARFRSDGSIADVIASALKHLPDAASLAGKPGQATRSGSEGDRVDYTASLSKPETETVEPTGATEDETSRAKEMISAALAGAKVRSAALPGADIQSSVLPANIGSAGLRQAALAGIPEAQFEIGSRFADGSNVKPDLSAAARWYEKAAAKGLAPAQFRLGSMYDKAKGVPRDRQRAARLYEAAAESGNAKAMHNLAVLYAEGGTGEADLPKAARWFLKAAQHGVRDSQFNIAILYARGLGLPENRVEAYKWFAIAAKSGDQQAAERRDLIAAKMDQDELSKALAALNIFQPIPLKPEANLVLEPRGGWASAASAVMPSGAELVSRIQTLLSQRGFDPGPADGVMGRRTAGAIEAFQAEIGLAKTGQPDLEVLSALEAGTI